MNSSGVSKQYKLDSIVMLAGGDKPDESIRSRYCFYLRDYYYLKPKTSNKNKKNMKAINLKVDVGSFTANWKRYKRRKRKWRITHITRGNQ